MHAHSNYEDIQRAHKVINSGVCNRFGCRILVKSNWNLLLMDSLLTDYDDRDVLEWLKFGFPISRDDDAPDPIPATLNHTGTIYCRNF